MHNLNLYSFHLASKIKVVQFLLLENSFERYDITSILLNNITFNYQEDIDYNQISIHNFQLIDILPNFLYQFIFVSLLIVFLPY